MSSPCYRGTNEPVRRGDFVRWHNDTELSEVIFVVSTHDFPEGDATSYVWFETEFGTDIMIDTPTAGWVLESEDGENIALVRRADAHA